MAVAIPFVMAAVSAVSALSAGAAQSQQYKAQAQADQYNALVARQRSSATLSAANQQEEQQRRGARLASGERRAAISQSGTGLGGSNADVDRQSEVLAELDALNIRYEGQSESTGLLNQANLDDFQAAANKKAAKSAMARGYLGAASSALSSYSIAGGSFGGGKK
jgi:hypothetical protein